MKKCQMLRIAKMMATKKFSQRLDGPFSVIAANAIHSGTSQKRAVSTHSEGAAVGAHSAIFFNTAGSITIRIMCADMTTADRIHRTAILVFHLKISMT